MMPATSAPAAPAAAALHAAAPVSAAQAAIQAGASLGSLLKVQIPGAGRKPDNARAPTPSQSSQLRAGTQLGRALHGQQAPAPSSSPAQMSALASSAKQGRALGAQLQAKNTGWMTRLEQAISQEGADPRALLNTTVDGMPVLPPGLTARQASMYLSHDWPAQREKTAHVIILISLGMPKYVLQNIFKQVVSNPTLRDETLFLMRGWANTKLGFPKTVSQLYRLQPSGPYKVSVAVDPTWFEQLHVRYAPDIIVANEPDMGMIAGDGLSVADAVVRIRAQKDLNKTFGQVWKITEPDVLKEIQNKVRTTNWTKIQHKAEQDMWQGVAQKAPAMPEQAHTTEGFFNPSVIATKTIRLPDGRVLVHKGDLINPLAQPLPWQTLRYIAFNASKPWEVRQALRWAQEYPTAKILMAAPPRTTQGWGRMEGLFQKQLFVLEPAVAQRLGIAALPSMVWPQGLELQVLTQGIPPKASAVAAGQVSPSP